MKCAHVLLFFPCACLASELTRVFSVQGGDRPCKGYVDMMVVLRRVAEAGDMIIAKEKF